MNRTYMQKGIGAAPFAIVAALILALAGGLWATQPAQAAAVGDVEITVQDIADTGVTFPDPDADADPSNTNPYGPASLTVETGNSLEASFAKDNPTGFRGAAQRGAWVEIQTLVVATANEDGTQPTYAGSYTVEISVSGEASLSSTTTLTSADCASQGLGNGNGGVQVCQFAVWATGNAGGFTVTATGKGATALTSVLVAKEGSLNGQWVGSAASAVVLDKAPARTATGMALTEEEQTALDADADGDDLTVPDANNLASARAKRFGTVSPAVILSGATAGLTEGNAGFLFQLTDSAGQVALSSDAMDRDAPRVRAVTDTGADLELAATGSIGTAGASAYVAIANEVNIDGYPTTPTVQVDGDGVVTYRAGGLIAVGLTALEDGEASIGRIVIDLPAGGSVEHTIAVAGNPDGDMSSVSAAASPLNLGFGDSHKREITLRDANGTAVPLDAAGIMASIVAAETDDDDQDLLLAVAAKSGATGVYVLTVTANEEETDDIAAVAMQAEVAAVLAEEVGRDDDDTRDADVGLHAFSVTIKNLAGDNDGVKMTDDADGNPLEAHVASGIDALSITSVTADQSDAELLSGDAGTPVVTVAAGTRLLNVTLSALGSDDAAPANDSAIATEHTSSNGRFIGSATSDDVGEATVRFIFGGEASNTTLIFGAGAYEQVLLVNVVDPDAPVDTGPVLYSLVDSAAGTFVTWQGGDVSSSVFENVADLVRVWKWTGSMWVGYNSNPAAPAGTKTSFTLSNNDIIYVVSNGPVTLSLG